MDVSIIIIHYKTLKLTTDCIRSIYEYTRGISFEIIVVDNDSQDGADVVIKSEFPAISWLNMGYNAGFSRANNTGIRAAKGRYYLLLNSDTELLDDSITRCVKRLDAQPETAACGGIQLFSDGSPPSVLSKFSYFQTDVVCPSSGAVFQKMLENSSPKLTTTTPIKWIGFRQLFYWPNGKQCLKPDCSTKIFSCTVKMWNGTADWDAWVN